MTNSDRRMWRPDGTLSHLGRPSWLMDDALQALMQAFEDDGFQIYAVGGCVRDTVIQREFDQAHEFGSSQPSDNVYSVSVNDIDLSTNAHPQKSIEIIERLTPRERPWKAVPTGIDHGTVTAVPPVGNPFEITTFRKDVETDGRRAVVAFAETLDEDARRRDFTINAFYVDRQGQVLDPVGGSHDLKERHIRFIGDPVQRIEEDYLRILRFFRFTATHGRSGAGVDAEGLAACALLADGLDKVSRERIGAEMTRIIAYWDAAPTVGTMEQSGVLGHILPGAGVETLARLVDLEEAYPLEGRMIPPADVPTRLAALGCADVAKLLRLPKAQADKIALVHAEAGKLTPPHELGYRHSGWVAVHCLLLRWASLLEPFDSSAIDAVWRGDRAVFPVSSHDLRPAFEGKALGDCLNALEAAWIASEFKLNKTHLLALP